MPSWATTKMQETHVLIENVSRYWIEIKFHYVIISWFRNFWVNNFVQNYNVYYSIFNMTTYSSMSSSFDRSKSIWYNGLMIWINLLTNQSRLYCTDTNEFFINVVIVCHWYIFNLHVCLKYFKSVLFLLPLVSLLSI